MAIWSQILSLHQNLHTKIIQTTKQIKWSLQMSNYVTKLHTIARYDRRKSNFPLLHSKIYFQASPKAKSHCIRETIFSCFLYYVPSYFLVQPSVSFIGTKMAKMAFKLWSEVAFSRKKTPPSTREQYNPYHSTIYGPLLVRTPPEAKEWFN